VIKVLKNAFLPGGENMPDKGKSKSGSSKNNDKKKDSKKGSKKK
jgi:hypothetical protein